MQKSLQDTTTILGDCERLVLDYLVEESDREIHSPRGFGSEQIWGHRGEKGIKSVGQLQTDFSSMLIAILCTWSLQSLLFSY